MQPLYDKENDCCLTFAQNFEALILSLKVIIYISPFENFISSIRSSSVYHGLLHTYRPLFQIFQIWSNHAYIHS